MLHKSNILEIKAESYAVNLNVLIYTDKSVFSQLEETVSLVKRIEKTGVMAVAVHGRYLSFFSLHNNIHY